MDTDTLSEHLFGSLLGAFDTVTVALGDELGLYDALHRRGPLTPAELAEHSSVHARYAREWLEQQTVAGLITVDDPALPADERRYSLPQEHVPVLADQDSLLFFRPYLTAVAAATSRFPQLLDAYRTGGGVAWHEFGDVLRRAQSRGNRPLFLSVLGQRWLPSIPDAHRALQAGGRVADIGCGEGWSAIGMALAYPDITVSGFDIDGDSIDAARRHAATYGLGDRVTFHHVDGADAHGEVTDTFDVVTAFECIHDLGDPVSVLHRMRHLAGESGVVLVMDERTPERFTGPGDPVEQMLYGYSTLICLPDGLSHDGSVGTGTVMRPETLREYAVEAGFADTKVLDIEHDTFRFYRLLT
jgi:SAM-dependent methyltransferase